MKSPTFGTSLVSPLRSVSRLSCSVLALSCAVGLAFFLAAAPTSASDGEEGFESLLEDGDLGAWRGYKMEGLPAGWSAEGDVLHFVPPTEEGAKRGDVITREQYEDFELRLEWKVAPGGNSGIFFRISEDQPATYSSAPEMQVLDDAGHRDGQSPLTSAGSNYALDPAPRGVVKPAGEWNEVVLRVEGPKVTHWLNGEKIVEYELWTDEWKEKVAGSKFRSMPRYGLNETGHIGLQDHGDEVWFRNIRIKKL